MSRYVGKVDVEGFSGFVCKGMCKAYECTDCDYFKKILEKLYHYEDLEEAGRLIELPCKVGDTVYVPTTKCAVEDCPIGREWDCDGCDWEEQFIIAERPFTYDKIEYIGKVYFLTKEEAEAKLAELKGGVSNG